MNKSSLSHKPVTSTRPPELDSLLKRSGRLSIGDNFVLPSGTSTSDIGLEHLSKQIEEAFNMDQDDSMALSFGRFFGEKRDLEKPKAAAKKNLTISVKPRLTGWKRSSGMDSLVDQDKGTTHTDARTVQKSPASQKSPTSVKSSKSDSPSKVVKYIRSPGDYFFFDIDDYESITSDEEAPDVDVSSKETIPYNAELVGADTKLEKAANYKNKRSHRWLRKRHKRHSSDETDLLSGLGDSSGPVSTKSSETSNRARDKAFQAGGSFSSVNGKTNTSSIGDFVSASNCTSPMSSVGQLSPTNKEYLPTKGRASKESPRSAIHQKIEYIRRETGTRVMMLSPKYRTTARRVNDDRIWSTKNLRCAHCLGECPVCGIACCVYEAAHQRIANSEVSVFDKESVKELVHIIEDLGSQIKDTSTYSLCSPQGGCGRRVCPDCCGVCPAETCEDIQCKDCKPDPWGPCDWHGFF